MSLLLLPTAWETRPRDVLANVLRALRRFDRCGDIVGGVMASLWTTLVESNPGLAEADGGELAWFPVTERAPVATDDEVSAHETCKSPTPLRLSDGRVIGGLYVPPTCTGVLWSYRKPRFVFAVRPEQAFGG